MKSNYPYAQLSGGEVSFHNGAFLDLPYEYTKPRNLKALTTFYKQLLAVNNEGLVTGTDPLGFDYVNYQNICNVGVLIGLSNSSISNNNRKKYPNNKFDRNYLIGRIMNDKKIYNLEEFIPIEIVTQNIHEIRNLNFKISSSIDEILDYSNDNEWETKFDNADDNVKKIYVSSRLTKFILDNIKFYMPNYLESLKPNLDRKFAIHKSVNKIVKIYSNDFKKRKASIDFEGNTYRNVQGDKEIFEIILMLLIENAVKYSRDAHSISPKVKIKEYPNRIVEIMIQSYGTMIPDEDIPKLFTRGYRSAAHNKTKDGSGMGLHNASKLIKLFGGELSYSKSPASIDDKVTGWNNFTVLCKQTIN